MPLSPQKTIAAIFIAIPFIMVGVAYGDDKTRQVSIEVFTTAAMPLANHPLPAGSRAENSAVNVTIIDSIHQLQVALSKHLPAKPEMAKRQALKYISAIGSTQHKHLKKTASGLAKALHYGIDRYPAIVFDGRVVVYGITDLRLALKHYHQWLEASAS